MVDPAEIERWRTTAVCLRSLALEVERALDPVAAYDRPDVWRGGRADRFQAALAANRIRLRAARWELESEALRAESQVRILEQQREFERLLPAGA